MCWAENGHLKCCCHLVRLHLQFLLIWCNSKSCLINMEQCVKDRMKHHKVEALHHFNSWQKRDSWVMIAFDYGIQMQTANLSLFSCSEGIVTVSYVHIILSEEEDDAFNPWRRMRRLQWPVDIRSVPWWLDGLIIKTRLTNCQWPRVLRYLIVTCCPPIK